MLDADIGTKPATDFHSERIHRNFQTQYTLCFAFTVIYNMFVFIHQVERYFAD